MIPGRVRSLFAAALLGLSASCGDAGASRLPPVEDACPRATYLFCRCEGDRPGTKLCRADGSGFEPCACGASSCEPGELISCGCGALVGVATCDEQGGVGACACEGGVVTGPSDACPGQALAVPRSVIVKIAGNTAKANPDQTSECGGIGPDQVFQLVPGASGRLALELRGIPPLDGVLYVSGAPCGGEIFTCVDGAPSGGTERLELAVTAGAPVFAFVDSFAEGGSFVLSATLSPDGPQGDACPGAAVTVRLAQSLSLTGTTVGYGDDFAGAGPCAAGKAAPDEVYAVTAADDGILRASLAPGGGASALLYAAHSCGVSAGGSCAGATGPSRARIELPLKKGESVSLVVDGTNAQGFAFELELSLTEK